MVSGGRSSQGCAHCPPSILHSPPCVAVETEAQKSEVDYCNAQLPGVWLLCLIFLPEGHPVEERMGLETPSKFLSFPVQSSCHCCL